MANEKVKFLKGQSSQLPAKNTAGAAVAGAFYLTNDTHRLYIGDDSGYLQELNQSITTIADLDALNALTTAQVSDGQFYYVSGSLGSEGNSSSGSNILVVANGTRTVGGQTKPAWIQINPDSFYQLTSSEAAIAVGTKSNKKIVVSTTVGEEKKGNAPGSAHTVTGSFTLEEGTNVTLTPTGNVIKIDAVDSKYDLTTNTNANKGEVVLEGPDDDDTVYFTGSNGIKVSSDNAGNVSIIGDMSVTAANAFAANGDFTTSISVNNGDAVASTPITPIIEYGNGDVKEQAKFESGTAVLDIYTKDEVDDKITEQLSVANALQYQGVVSSDNFTTKTTGAKAGYTYKASNEISVPGGKTAKVGDLIIAEEDSNKNIVWEVVPSGDDQFITGSYNASQNYWELRDGSKSNNPILAARRLSAGTGIAISSGVSEDTNILTTTITHGNTGGSALDEDTTVTNTTLGTNYNSTLTIPIVTSLTKDSFGHITAGTIQSYKFQHAAISDPTLTYTESGNTKAIGYSFSYGGQDIAASLNLKSDTIAFSNDSSALRADIVWGSFGSNS